MKSHIDVLINSKTELHLAIMDKIRIGKASIYNLPTMVSVPQIFIAIL